jgi:hypothetical protein
LIRIEKQIRQANRDAVNRNSRKPFDWGGLAGYQQLQAIDQALRQVNSTGKESHYLHSLSKRVARVLNKNRTLACELQEAHHWLEQIARCLRYPPRACQAGVSLGKGAWEQMSTQQVAHEMETLLLQFQPDPKRQPVQTRLLNALQKRWRLYGQELLHCYAIPGLPPDNLQMESLFGRLRRHQRRISGRKSTVELHAFGQVQVLFVADSEQALLKQIQSAALEDYLTERGRLAQAEAPGQFLRRLHHNPFNTVQTLLELHPARCFELDNSSRLACIDPVIHTD